MQSGTWAALGALGMAAAGAAAYGVVSPGSQLWGPVLTAPRRPGEVALTYDDGPNPGLTPWLLDVLAAHRVQATFFLIGRWALTEPALVRRLVAEGHALGNHTMTHPRLPLCTHARIRSEITDGKRTIEDISGRAVTLFRPPHGYRTPAVLRAAREAGMHTTTWTTIANDWKLTDPAAILSRVETGIRASTRRGLATNLAMHDGSQLTARADRTPTVHATAALLDRPGSLRFVTLEDWL